MPGRTRPIEKFAEATAKCSPEVGPPLFLTKAIAHLHTGRGIWQMHCGELSKRTQGHVRKRIHAAERLLSRKPNSVSGATTPS